MIPGTIVRRLTFAMLLAIGLSSIVALIGYMQRAGVVQHFEVVSTARFPLAMATSALESAQLAVSKNHLSLLNHGVNAELRRQAFAEIDRGMTRIDDSIRTLESVA